VDPVISNDGMIRGLEKGADGGEGSPMDIVLGSKGKDGDVIYKFATIMPTGVNVDINNVSKKKKKQEVRVFEGGRGKHWLSKILFNP
jgi:hypothetical protein